MPDRAIFCPKCGGPTLERDLRTYTAVQCEHCDYRDECWQGGLDDAPLLAGDEYEEEDEEDEDGAPFEWWEDEADE